MGGLLQKRVALITGATRLAGIGAAVAERMAQEGADIAFGYFRPYDRAQPWGVKDEEPAALLDRLQKKGVRAFGFEIDLSDPKGVRQLFSSVRDALGDVHILVNNAAYSREVQIDALDGQTLDHHYSINLRATALLCAEFVRHYSGGFGGRIINLTSGQGISPMPNELAYAATKGGIDALTLSLSSAVASRGITVNAVDPGPTDTGWITEEVREQLLAAAPTGRVGKPDDVAGLIVFLASDDAAFITGQIIRSRGGP